LSSQSGEDTLTIDLAADDIRIVRRTTTQPVRSFTAQQAPQGCPCFLGHP
jgi:hypothetical protein